jgi:hypothetical protein
MNEPKFKSRLDSNTAMETSPDNRTHEDYRAICKTAILSIVFSVFALLLAALMFMVVELALMAAIVAVFGLVFAIIAFINLKKYPDELLGWKSAKIGFIACLVVLISSVGLYSYVYATEVPEGYQRISFRELKPNKRRSEVIPPAAEELDGQKVFIKGFIRPNDRKVGLQKFTLVGDFGSCCFGGNPDITDVIAIELDDGKTADYSLRVRRIAGTFRLNKTPKRINEEGVPEVHYTIEANYIK